MNLLPLLFPLLPVLALAPRWIPQSGINLSGTISDLSTSWVTFTLSSHTAGRAEVSLICHRASAPRSAMLTRPAEWNPPWQKLHDRHVATWKWSLTHSNHTKHGPHAQCIICRSGGQGGDWTGAGRVPIISIKAQSSFEKIQPAVWTNHSGASITEVLWHAQRN